MQGICTELVEVVVAVIIIIMKLAFNIPVIISLEILDHSG